MNHVATNSNSIGLVKPHLALFVSNFTSSLFTTVSIASGCPLHVALHTAWLRTLKVSTGNST